MFMLVVMVIITKDIMVVDYYQEQISMVEVHQILDLEAIHLIIVF